MAMAELSLADDAAGERRGAGLRDRLAGPLLGLVVPVVLAIGWELAVRAGLSNGRLVPPPSVIIQPMPAWWG